MKHSQNLTPQLLKLFLTLGAPWKTYMTSVLDPVETTFSQSREIWQLRCSIFNISKRCEALWIDTVCIDRQNTKERGQQVERMRDIYMLADRVVVWLLRLGARIVHLLCSS
jgi:hypothetical protein